MSLTNFPNGVTSFGVPIHGGNFGWRRGATTWFVDGDNGSDGNSGKETERAFATIGKAISLASAFDVIYILDRGLSGTDPQPYLESNDVAYAQSNLAIVGVPHNIHNTYGLQVKGAAADTGPILDINAPFCTVENLGFNRGGSTTAGIRFYDEGDTTNQAQGSSVYNCAFRNCRGATTGASGGAVYIYGGWNYIIADCHFYNCRGGITAASSAASTIQGIQILGCRFMGTTTSVDTDIHISGVSINNLIHRCVFGHDVPAYAGAGAITAYIYDGVTVDGNVSNCYFATDDASCNATATSEIVLATTVRISGCYDEAGLVARA